MSEQEQGFTLEDIIKEFSDRQDETPAEEAAPAQEAEQAPAEEIVKEAVEEETPAWEVAAEAAEETVEEAAEEVAEETAEETVDEYACKYESNEKNKLPGEERTEHCVKSVVCRVEKESYCSAECTRGTYVLTECGQRHILECVNQGEYDYQKSEYYVLKIGKNLCYSVLSELGSFDFVEKILNKTEGTKEAAYRSSEYDSVQQNNTENVVRGAFSACGERILKRSEWA